MKYVFLLSFAALMAGCSSSVTPEGASGTSGIAGESEAATSSGVDGVYSGGGSYEPGVDVSGSYTGGSGTGNYSPGSFTPSSGGGNSAAANGDFYNNPAYGQNVVGGPTASAKDRIIYFAYDSTNIDSRAESIVQQHADYLKSNPNVRVLLAGHTDSRGSREYNIALGERRTVSVLQRFQSLGVPASQIRVVSYGEESPAVNGYSEEAYKRNRRAVIQY